MQIVFPAESQSNLLYWPSSSGWISQAANWQLLFHPSLVSSWPTNLRVPFHLNLASWLNSRRWISTVTNWQAPFHRNLASWLTSHIWVSSTTDWRDLFHPSMVSWPKWRGCISTTTILRAACHFLFVLLLRLFALIAERLSVHVAHLALTSPPVIYVLLLEVVYETNGMLSFCWCWSLRSRFLLDIHSYRLW